MQWGSCWRRGSATACARRCVHAFACTHGRTKKMTHHRTGIGTFRSVRGLAFAAAALFSLSIASSQRADAMSLMTPGASPAKVSSEGLIQVRGGGGHGGGGHGGGFHGGGFHGGGFHGGGFHGGGFHGGGNFHHGDFRGRHFGFGGYGLYGLGLGYYPSYYPGYYGYYPGSYDYYPGYDYYGAYGPS